MADYGGPGNIFVQGFGIGSSSAAQAFNTDLRRQQLISEDRARRLQEAQTAQHMSMLLDQHNQQIQYRADMQKGIAQSILESSMPTPRDTVNDPGGESSDPSQGVQLTPNTNSLQYINALAKNTLPIVAKYEPEKVQAYQSGLFTDALNLAKAQKEQTKPEAGTFTESIDPRTGKRYSVFNTGMTAQLMSEGANITQEVGPDGRSFDVFNPGGRGAPRLIPPDAAKRSTDLAMLKSQLDQQKQRQKVIQESGLVDGLEETVDPSTGAVITTEKPGAYAEALKRKATALVPAERGRVQAQTLAGAKAADAARNLVENMDAVDFGPAGTFKNFGEKLVALANIPIGERSAVGARASMARFRESLASLGASQGLNAGTKQRLLLLMHDAPDAESFISGGPVIKIQTAEILNQISNDMEENFAALQQPLPDQWKDPIQLRDELISQNATADEIRKKLKGNIRAMAGQFKHAGEIGK